jgi:hypothetical protein
MTDPVFVHTARTRRRTCPACQTPLDAATSLSLDAADPQPTLSPGDLTGCAGCGTILVVTRAGFRVATDKDLSTLDPKLRAILLQFVAEHPTGQRRS